MIEYDSAYSFHPTNVKSISTHICSGELSHSSTKKDVLQINADAFWYFDDTFIVFRYSSAS